MDWPLIGAVAGVTALAGVTVYGAIAVTRTVPERPKKAPQMTSLTLVEPRTDLAGSQAPRLPQSNILVWGDPSDSSPSTDARTKAAPPRVSAPSPVRIPTQPQAKPAAPPAQKKTVVAYAPSAPQATGPQQRPPPLREDRRYDGVLTVTEIAKLRRALRLTLEQQPHWPAVESVLRDIGRRQVAQIEGGRKGEVDMASLQRLYGAAQPLLAILRPEQKEYVRRLVRSLGYGSYASMI